MDRRYVSNLAFIDLLFNLILGFVMLFLISFLLINNPAKTSEIEYKAEIIVVMSWQDDHEGDIDLWVETPNGKVSYINPVAGHVHLDKDDLGIRNDYYTLPNGQVEKIYLNREIVTLRALQPGDYIVNAHYYSSPSIGSESYDTGIPADVTVEVIRLNPFQIIHSSNKTLNAKGQEETFVRFTIADNGYISKINRLPKSLVAAEVRSTNGPTLQSMGTGGF